MSANLERFIIQRQPDGKYDFSLIVSNEIADGGFGKPVTVQSDVMNSLQCKAAGYDLADILDMATKAALEQADQANADKVEAIRVSDGEKAALAQELEETKLQLENVKAAAGVIQSKAQILVDAHNMAMNTLSQAAASVAAPDKPSE